MRENVLVGDSVSVWVCVCDLESESVGVLVTDGDLVGVAELVSEVVNVSD